MLSDDHASRGEAWVRKKPKRIIQNQFLIQLLIAELPISAMVAAILVLYIIMLFPFVVMLILSLWGVSVMTYVGFFVYRRFYVK